jgi:hypothetical protein
MKLFLIIILLSLALPILPVAQVNNNIISFGSGYSNAANSSNSGYNYWLQFSKGVSKRISLATDFEHLEFKQPNAYVINTQKNPEQKVSDNNISLVVQYNFLQKHKVSFSIGSGIAYKIKLIEYYDTYYFAGVTGEITTRNVVGGSFIELPIIGNTYYSISKKILLGLRLKYNISPKDVSTYSASLGVAIQL